MASAFCCYSGQAWNADPTGWALDLRVLELSGFFFGGGKAKQEERVGREGSAELILEIRGRQEKWPPNTQGPVARTAGKLLSQPGDRLRDSLHPCQPRVSLAETHVETAAASA